MEAKGGRKTMTFYLSVRTNDSKSEGVGGAA